MEKINQNKNNETEPFKDKEWIGFRLAIKYILILTFIILSSVLITSIFAQGQTTTNTEYTLSDAIIVDNDVLLTNSTQNFINDTTETKVFNASYSFTDDAIGSNPTGWIINENTGTVDVINTVKHNKVIEIHDTGASYPNAKQEFTEGNQESGTIELWIRSSDCTKLFGTYISHSLDGVGIQFKIDNDLWYEYSSGSWNLFEGASIDNIWYHIRVDFECTSNAYLGLAPDTYFISINGMRYGAFSFRTARDYIDYIYFRTLEADSGYYCYIDALGYSWNTNYTIKDNVIPYSYTIDNLTIDKWNFFHNANGSITEAGQQEIPYFTEVGTLGYIVKNQELCEDETAVYFPIATATEQGIYRDIDIESYNTATILTKCIRGGNSASETLYEYYEIYSYDDTLLVRLRIDDTASSGDLKLYYFNGAGYTLITDIADGFYNYIFNITLIHGYVNFMINTTTYIFDSLDSAKDGIGSVKIYAKLSGIAPAQTGLFLDYVGVYINSSSIANDFGAYLYPTNMDFKPQHYNFVEINASGYFGLGFNSYEVAGLSVELFDYSNVSAITFDNVYDKTAYLVENAYLVLSTNQTDSFNITSIYIHGINMSDGTNSYFPTITSSNVDIDVSYFYLVGSTLRYTMYIDNSSQTEYIQATFNLVNMLTVNKSFTFKGYSNSIGLGNVWLEYTDTNINLFELKPHTHTENLLLPQDKIIDQLHFRITDDNLDVLNGYTATGYISDIGFIYIPNIDVAITTLSLLTVLVPILVLMIPTLIMYGKFGKSAVIPTMMLMSIICFIGSLIPPWLFALMMFGFGAMLVFQLKEGGTL